MIVTQDYGWSQVVRRRGRMWPEAADWAMDQAVLAGFDGWEPYVQTAADAVRIGRLAVARGLAMPSVFVSGDLIGIADIERMKAAARAAVPFGARWVAVYPAAREGRQKSDAELDLQADHLCAFARALGPDLRVLYHPEEPEMQDGAREVHHVLGNCAADLVGFCLDPDTFWRGGGMAAVMETIDRHGDRVEALHIRQSQGGVWAEVVGPGDMDYPAIAAALAAKGSRPLLVVEHAYDAATVVTLDPVAAHRQSRLYVASTFGAVA